MLKFNWPFMQHNRKARRNVSDNKRIIILDLLRFLHPLSLGYLKDVH